MGRSASNSVRQVMRTGRKATRVERGQAAMKAAISRARTPQGKKALRTAFKKERARQGL